MVQRKLTNKLGIQDHVKTEKLLVNHKPSSLQHQDVKNRGSDLKKKKMKKSGSIKRPESNNLRSPNTRIHVKQPGKPPPAVPPPTPQKLITTPNYMKSTTSFDARKEKSQVSTTKSPQISTTPTSSNSSKIRQASSNNKPAKLALARTTSLKMMRTPSFKPIRATTRKCSPVVLCENLDAQRPTCSSTLKDSKFPAYLTLNPGATESEGTSAMKVCPYTYCSLNGHRHNPLPPLKCILSARRRVLKAQRSVKLGCLSPRRVKPIGDGPKNMISDSAAINSTTQEHQNDFFIEIYSVNNENSADLMPSVGDGYRTEADCHEKQVVEKLPDGPISSDLDSDQNLDHGQVLNPTQITTAVHFNEENMDVEVAEEVAENQSLAREETKFGSFSDIATETMESQINEADSEGSDMDWETGDYSALYLDDDEFEYPSKPEKVAALESWEIHDEFMIKLDNSIRSCFSEYVGKEEVSQESFDEEGFSSDAWSSSDESCDSLGSYDYMESSENMNTTTSVPDVFPAEEQEAAPEDKNESSANEEISADEDHNLETENHVSDENQKSNIENQDQLEIDTFNPIVSDKDPQSDGPEINSTQGKCHLMHEAMTQNSRKTEAENSSLSRAMVKRKKPVQDLDELGEFNPRAPNFLPVEPDPDAEKVDLRHQQLDERKNAEEWMVDYALRQAVTKLAPARKRKVALLVEAFEKVMPIAKSEIHLRHSSAFDHARPVQACN